MHACWYAIVHAKVPPSQVIPRIEFDGKSKWLALNLGCHNVMCTCPIAKMNVQCWTDSLDYIVFLFVLSITLSPKKRTKVSLLIKSRIFHSNRQAFAPSHSNLLNSFLFLSILGPVCHKNQAKSYGRGVGRIPSLVCPSHKPDLHLGLCYKSCPSGWSSVGCCLCRSGWSLKGRGTGSLPSEWRCPSDRPDKQAGLCYPRCNSGYTGVGHSQNKSCIFS